MARAVFTPVDVVAAGADTITLAAPNAAHLAKCREHLSAVEQACTDGPRHGRSRIELIVARRPADPERRRPPPPADDDVDLDDLVDAPPGSVPSTIDRLAEAFPGSELVERDR